MISLKELKNLSKLSALSLSDEELEAMKKDFNEIMKFIDKIKEAEIIEDFSYEDYIDFEELRDDVVKESMPREKVLSNAPEAMDGTFVVPKVVE